MATTSSGVAHLAVELRTGVGGRRQRLVAEHDGDLSLSLTATSVLRTLERLGPSSMRELAAYEQLRPPSITRLARALEDGDHVHLEAHAHDGRIAIVKLSDRGREVVRADRRSRNAWSTKALRSLPPEQREVLRSATPLLDSLSRRT